MVTDTHFDENENPTFTDGCNINGEKGYYIKGEDVIYLDAPKIRFSENAPLETEKRELYDILNELFQGGGGGGDDDWQPPESWITVPEPDDYDIYALVNAIKPQSGVQMTLTDTNSSGGNGTIVCDWGDGTTEELTGVALISHTYSNIGQFLIHITCTDKNNFLSSLGSPSNTVYHLIIKTGSEIFWVIKNNITFTGTASLTSLKSLTILNDKSIRDVNEVDSSGSGYERIVDFGNMRVLQKLQCPQVYVSNLNAGGSFLRGTSTRNMKNILQRFDLSKCTSLKKIGTYDNASGLSYNMNLTELTLPNCTYIGDGMFRGCESLKKIIAPKCTYVGARAFENCYALEQVEFAENCTFGSNCFDYCYSLYPRPDGSVN